MSLVENANSDEPGFYLPHHAVIKSFSLTTKSRVVFDDPEASVKSHRIARVVKQISKY